ncbi:LysM-like peptidoglycan-binding domain-containing protein [Vibrio panuliri]|uniref:Lysine transporter LysM n=1 Tax=Vibrio panuliri TaxID=1381081 RepID=A0A1Q9H8Y4_9VIBR|nr:LysM-like peptidoglycan-binding domain-containing protein [Vibrio panuliri]KAB1459184.1 lysine transporter LysM [Vibrio panuliri]OLQ85058.1 lysine transporter LysM [Vibrio panuliri]OLQ85396.1 lysine transporter LysM [Vibrio panuliri]
MNRRKKKTQQVDYIQLAKDKVSAIDWMKAKQGLQSRWAQLPKLHQRALMVLVPVVLLLMLIPLPQSEPNTEQVEPQRVAISVNTQSLSEQGEPKTQPLQSDQWQEYTVKSGDTLAQVFRANDLPMADLNALVKVEGSDKPLSHIKAGQLVRFKIKTDGTLDMLQLEKSSKSVMFFRLSDGGFAQSK